MKKFLFLLVVPVYLFSLPTPDPYSCCADSDIPVLIAESVYIGDAYYRPNSFCVGGGPNNHLIYQFVSDPIRVPATEDQTAYDKYIVKDYECTTCDQPDTNFTAPQNWQPKPDLYYLNECSDEETGSVEQCTEKNGATFSKRTNCCTETTCFVPPCDHNDTKFPPPADNERIIDTWEEPEDHSTQCTDNHGTVQEKTVSCKKHYRCVAPNDFCPPESNVPISSYVSPRGQVFHEDIALPGVGFGLHYSSANLDDTSIAAGWSLSVGARMAGDRVYFGSGTIRAPHGYTSEGGFAIIPRGDEAYRFDANGALRRVEDLHTRQLHTAFTYDGAGRLIGVEDRYGQTTTIERDANGTATAIVAPTGQRTLLQIDEDGDLTEVQYEDTSAYRFDYTDHLMTQEIEPNGHVFEHRFADGKLTQVIDAEQGEWDFAAVRQEQSFSRTVTYASGEQIQYLHKYARGGMIRTETILPTGDRVIYEDALDESNRTITRCGMRTTLQYRMHSSGYLDRDPYSQRPVLTHRTVATPSGLQQVTTYTRTYDNYGGLLTARTDTTTRNGHTSSVYEDYNQSTVTYRSPEGHESVIEYDDKKQPITVRTGNLLPIAYTYDAHGRLTDTRQGSRRYRYTYDARGNRITAEDLQRHLTTRYAYDLLGRVTQVTYPDGAVETFDYDANGNLIARTVPTPAEHTFAYNGVNRPVSLTDPAGHTTRYTWDKQRRVKSITRPSGRTIAHTYARGRLATIETPEGSTTYSYACDTLPAAITASTGESLHYTYDGTLPVTVTTGGTLNQTLQYTYGNDLVPTSMHYAGEETPYGYDGDGLMVHSGAFTIARDAQNGSVRRITDGTLTRTMAYNDYGEVSAEEDGDFGYTLGRDDTGRIRTKMEHLADRNVTYTYRYDRRGRLVEVNASRSLLSLPGHNLLKNAGFESLSGDRPQFWHPYGINTTPDTDTETHSGDVSVKITNDTEGNSGWRGEAITIDHQKTLTFGGWSKAEDVSPGALYALDFKVTFEDGTYRWYYSDTRFATGTHDWQQIKITRTFDKPVVSVRPYVLLYRGTGTVWFDDVSVQVGGSVPHGLYNGDFETLSGGVPVGWRAYNNPATQADTEHTHSGTHAIKIVNTTSTRAGWYGRTFDLNGTHTVTFGGWSKAEDVSSGALYALDFRVEFADGSYLWYYADTRFDTGTHDWQHIEITKTFDKPVVKIRPYALLYRGTGTAWFDDIYVTDEEATPPSDMTTVESYTYDANGNRASATVYGKPVTAHYTLDDRLIVYGDNTYRYDDDGYLIEKVTPNGTTTYAYNTLGALTDVTLPDGTTIHYVTDPLNRHIAREVNGTITEKYLWADLTTLLAVYDGNDNLVQRFEYADGRMPVAMTQGGQKYYLHYDQVGSLRAVSDANHNIVKEIIYDTYGNILTDTNPSFKVPFGFAGGLYDSDTKLTHFGYREYDAHTGKWTAKDPIGFAGGDSNLYGYVLGDPVNHKDPSGLAGIKIDPNNLPKPPKGTPTIKQPEFIPKIPTQTHARMCSLIFAACMQKCRRSVICKVVKPVKYGCYAKCVATLAICRLKSAE